MNNDRQPAHLKIWKVADGTQGIYFAWSYYVIEFNIAEIEALWLSGIEIWSAHFMSTFSIIAGRFQSAFRGDFC